MAKIILPLAALLALAAAPALAADDGEAARQSLRYNRASLDRADARESLRKRIAPAAATCAANR